MRELCKSELSMVGGGGDVADAVTAGTAIGAAAGVSFGASAGATGTAIVGAAAIGGATVGGLTAAAFGGYAAGSWLNDNTPIQSWISDGIDSVSSFFGSFSTSTGAYSG